MKKILVFSAAMFLLPGVFLNAGTGDSFSISGMVHFFQPTDSFFKDIYGGAAVFGGEIGFKVWKGIRLWAGADIYQKKGTTTFSKEETELRIIPIFGGLMYQFMDKQIRPYLAVGIGYFLYRETNPIELVEDGDLGFIVQAGVRYKAIGPLFFDARAGYSLCKSKSTALEVELGGIRGGIGIGVEF